MTTDPSAAANRAVMKVPYVGIRAAIVLKTAVTTIAVRRALRRPTLSERVPQIRAPRAEHTNDTRAEKNKIQL